MIKYKQFLTIQWLQELLKQNSEFAWNYGWRVLQMFGKQGASFGIFLIAIFLLSQQQMGVYNYVLGVVGLIVMFIDLGISTATSKYVTQYAATDTDKLKRVVPNALLILTTLTVIVGGIFGIWGQHWFNEYYDLLLLCTPILILSPISSLYDGVFRGLKRFKELAVISITVGGISLPLSYILVNIYGINGLFVAMSLLYFFLVLILVVRYRGVSFKYDKSIIKSISSYSLAFGVATVGYYLFSRVNLLILGKYDFLIELAHYELLNKIFIVYLMPFTILGQVIAPYITEVFSLKKYDELIDKFRGLLKKMALVVGLFIVTTSVITPLIVRYFVPDYYTDTFWIILIPIVFTYAGMAFSAPINAGFIVATGHAMLMTKLNIILGVLNTAIAIWATAQFGFVGSIYTTLITQTIAIVILLTMYRRKLQELFKTET